MMNKITDEQIDAIWKSFDGDNNWIRTFGYQQFARAVIELVTPVPESQPAAPYAWTRKAVICNEQGYAIGMDEPEFRVGAESPGDDIDGNWSPLFFASSAPAAAPVAAGAQARIAELEAELAKMRRARFIINQALRNVLVGNQSAWLEWDRGAGAEAAMEWIHNGLVGPGLIPKAEPGVGAQAWFDANVDDRMEPDEPAPVSTDNQQEGQ